MSAERIVERAPNWIGDVVMALPAVRDLRRNFPAARIECLARPWVAELLRAVAEVDAVRESARPADDAAALRGAFDVGVLLPNSFGAALALRRAGIRERWGYATDGRRPLLTRAARVPPEVRGRSQVYYYRAMLAGVGLRVTATPDASLRCLPEWSAQADALLDGPGPWIGLNPGASFGTAKRWLPERYAAVGDLVARRTGARVAIVGGAGERALGDAIAGGMREPVRNLCGRTTLGGMAAVLSRMAVVITNDSGPMHVAAALGVPVVAVFGPTDERETGPVGGGHHIVREPVHCSPCGLRECPIDHRCMTRIGVDRVAAEAREALARG